jgi:hypothetical protein
MTLQWRYQTDPIVLAAERAFNDRTAGRRIFRLP